MLTHIRTLAAAVLVLGTSTAPLLAHHGGPHYGYRHHSERAFQGVANIVVVTRPASGYRQFDIRPRLDLTAGETLHLYAEPVSFGVRRGDGRLRLHIAANVEFLSPSGEVIDALPNPIQIINEFAPHARGLYLNIRRQVPSLPAGAYQLRVKFRDMFTGATVENTRRVTVRPGQSAPQPAAPETPPTAAAPEAPVAAAPPPPPAADPAPVNPATFSVDALQFVENQAPGYRQQTPRRSNVYAPGERFHIYFEPKNLRTRFDGQNLQGAMSIDVILRNAAGQLVAEQKRVWDLPVTAPSTAAGPLTQVFASISTSLNVLPGNYRLALRINDDLAGASTEVALDIVIQGAPVAPQASAPATPAPQTPPRQAQATQTAPEGSQTPQRRSVTGLLR